MTQDKKSHVQIASSNVTLEDIEQLLVQRSEPTENGQSSIERDDPVAKPLATPHLRTKLKTANDSRFTVVRVPEIRQSVPGNHQQQESTPNRLHRMSPKQVHSVPFVQRSESDSIPVVSQANSPQPDTPTTSAPDPSSVPDEANPSLPVHETNEVDTVTEFSTYIESLNPDGFEPDIVDKKTMDNRMVMPFLPGAEPTHVLPVIADRSKTQGRGFEETLIPVADISERPSDWMPDHDTGEKRTTKKATPLDTPKQAFQELANNVLEKFPLGPSSVLLIADVDGHSDGYAVAYQLGKHLAERNVGRVLVVDSHFEERRLTERLSLGSEIGLADIIAIDKRIEETICETELPNLDFLPVGTKSFCNRRDPGSFSVTENIKSLKEEYQFVIVSVGNVFHRATTMWGRYCDATYLALEMRSSNQTLAKSGVVRLQQYGARLMGCVVTDAA